MILCYRHFVHSDCMFGDKCRYVHEFDYDPAETYMTGTGGVNATIRPIAHDEVRLLHPIERKRFLWEREFRNQMKDVQSHHARNLEEAKRIVDRGRFRKERETWDVVHPSKIILVDAAVNNERLVFRCRVPRLLKFPRRYIRYAAIRFVNWNDGEQWIDELYDELPRFDFETITVREGDVTCVGFVPFDPKCVLILHEKLPADLMRLVYHTLNVRAQA